ncbi:MAG: Trm112 family protein [Terracidiphilus sp.]
MPADSSKKITFNASILDQLACPVCLGALRLDGERLVCAGCGRGYPIVDGIPVLIGSRGSEPSQTVWSATSSTSDSTRRTE